MCARRTCPFKVKLTSAVRDAFIPNTTGWKNLLNTLLSVVFWKKEMFTRTSMAEFDKQIVNHLHISGLLIDSLLAKPITATSKSKERINFDILNWLFVPTLTQVKRRNEFENDFNVRLMKRLFVFDFGFLRTSENDFIHNFTYDVETLINQKTMERLDGKCNRHYHGLYWCHPMTLTTSFTIKHVFFWKKRFD